jgi:hypothetical protein
MTIAGFILALLLFKHFNRRLKYYRWREFEGDERWRDATGAASWHREWERHWAEKFQRHA